MTNISEPGQYRGPRKLSQRSRQQIEQRISDIKNMLKLFPHDEKLTAEMDKLEERIQEAELAEADERPDSDLVERLARERQRLARVEQRMQNGMGDDPRLQAEAEQLRATIARLEQQMLDRKNGKTTSIDSPQRQPRKSAKEEEMDKEARDAARALAQEKWKDALQDLEMNQQDAQIYLRYKEAVKQEVHELRSTLDALQAKRNERVWLRRVDAGDLDDRMLVEGLTGSRNIYKRRGDAPPDPFAFMRMPKRVTFVFDVSSSMAHMSMDGRLERSLESATLIFEAFRGHENKVAYKIRGHSGSTDDLTFVNEGHKLTTDVAKLNVLRSMNLHAETCSSGDNTIDAARLAIKEMAAEESDESFVVLTSDANLAQYSITSADLKALIDLDERVNVFILFIGTMGQQAQQLKDELPSDRVFVTLKTSDIPGALKKIFMNSLLT